MFARIALLGLQTFAGLTQLLPEAEQDVLFTRVVGEATNPQSASHTGGANVLFGDGSVRFVKLAVDVQSYEVGGLRVLDWFWHEATQELKLGAWREDWQSLPEVRVRPEEFDPSALFSYAGLASATRLVVEPAALEKQLLRSLRLAEAAEARGQQAAHDRFTDQYSRQARRSRFRSFSLLDRTQLIAMARALKDSETPVP